jgi:hypothetical protein
MLGAVISSGKATLHELDTVYGTEDLHDMIEIVLVDAHNQRLLSRREED